MLASLLDDYVRTAVLMAATFFTRAMYDAKQRIFPADGWCEFSFFCLRGYGFVSRRFVSFGWFGLQGLSLKVHFRLLVTLLPWILYIMANWRLQCRCAFCLCRVRELRQPRLGGEGHLSDEWISGRNNHETLIELNPDYIAYRTINNRVCFCAVIFGFVFWSESVRIFYGTKPCRCFSLCYAIPLPSCCPGCPGT